MLERSKPKEKPMMTDKPSLSNNELRRCDKEAWWHYIAEYYPENYARALAYYSDSDDLLSPEFTPQNFDINDYFEIYDLPRITAVNGVISVNGKKVKRYADYVGWLKKRIQFEKLKETSTFRAWRAKQFGCQYGKCAWCKKQLSGETHVDHISPLVFDGDNSFRNLVLSCADCNIQKSIKTTGYNPGMNRFKLNATPDWITTNDYTIKYPTAETVLSMEGQMSKVSSQVLDSP